jgi:glycosyltransferase involved in cell wall biosynthesis
MGTEDIIVSCIIPTYNRQIELKRAIKSVVNQSYKKLDIVVVDANYGDNISKKLKQYINEINDERIRFIDNEQSRRLNGAEARNIGIETSKGNYIAFLDDDDEWLVDKIKLQVEALTSDVSSDRIKAVSCLVGFFKKGKLVKKSKFKLFKNMHKQVLLRNFSIYTSTVLFEKQALLSAGVFDENLTRHQDLQLFLDFLIKYEIKLLDTVLVSYHMDDNQNRPNSTNMMVQKKAFFASIGQHIKLYSFFDRRRIFGNHKMDIALLYLREKRLLSFLKVIFTIFPNPMTYIDFINRYFFKTRKL